MAEFAHFLTPERYPLPYSLAQPPPGISDDDWTSSKPATPVIGDLWLLSWNGDALALAVVSGVAPSFVLVWPATLPNEPTFPPAIAIEQSPLGGVNVWPSRETGVGTHLLHRNLGRALSERTMALVLEAFEEDAEPPLAFAEPNVQLEDRSTVSDEMVDRWEAINTHIWPEPTVGQTPFDPDALRSHGVSVSSLREVLNLSTPEAVALLNDNQLPTASEVKLLADSLELSIGEVLLSQHDEMSQELLTPRIKEDVLRIAEIHHVDEAGARMLLRQEFALAARSDQDPSSRLDAAIHRLIIVEEPRDRDGN